MRVKDISIVILLFLLALLFTNYGSYKIGYERGKNNQIWKNFYEQVEMDSLKSISNHKHSMRMYNLGFMQGHLKAIQEIGKK